MWTAATTLKRVIELLEEEQGIKIDDIRVELPGVDKTLNILERIVLKEAMGRSVRKNPGESVVQPVVVPGTDLTVNILQP